MYQKNLNFRTLETEQITMINKQNFTLILMALTFCTIGMSQSNTESTKKSYYFDLINGPYLFVDHIPYDAVMMTGARLGHRFNSRFHGNIEYVVGQQHDDQNTLGLTHNVNFQFCYDLSKAPKKFAPYIFAGGGMMEFKSFTTDAYGIQYNVGAGTTLKITDRLYGLIEARYFNLGLLDLGGQHEVAVFWGIRGRF